MFFWQKYRLLRKRSSRSLSQDDISLSQIGEAPSLRDRIDKDDSTGRVRNRWYILCYVLHAFLVVLQILLLSVAAFHHAEHQIIIQNDIDSVTIGLSGGLQAFYTLYTTLLVFITQKLMLSTLFSRPKKLTEIHDICGAWAGLGASLGALWQQTKVASSVLSITLVTVYFACISVLHITSTTLIQLQVFNGTMSVAAPVTAIWPSASVNLGSLDWLSANTLVPSLQALYGNATNGLANNTLYDIYNISTPGFINTTVNATTLNAHCGLLTNLSMNYNTWNVTVSMSDLDTFNASILVQLLPNEIWFPPIIQCSEPFCLTYPLYLVSSALDIDDSVGGVDSININGTYTPPGSTPQNFSFPIYIVACSMNAMHQTAVLGPSGIELNSSIQSINATWSTFSPDGDLNLTTISNVMKYSDSLPTSPYCQPLMMSPPFWESSSALNIYMSSLLGMPIATCGVTSSEQYITPSLLTRDKMESAVALITAQALWTAGELGTSGGGFDRQVETGQILGSVLQWRLNINVLPAILSLSASGVLLVLVICVLWQPRSVMVSGAGVLEIMWFGSRSRVLRDHLRRDAEIQSLDSLRGSSMFETIFWTRLARGQEEISDPSAAVQLYDGADDPSSSRPFLPPVSGTSGNFDLSHLTQRRHIQSLGISSNRRWCYTLHVMLVALHIVLLALLIHHPEQSVVVSDNNSTVTIGLSAFLQAFYTLYSTALVFLMQRLALFRITRERQKLTVVHDASAAWTGIGTAIHTLWQQHKLSSSIRKTIAAGAYLAFMLVLHITSSSVMQWQAFNGMLVGTIQTDLAMPDNNVNISQLGWIEMVSIVDVIEQDTRMPTYGLSNNTLYDVARDPSGVPFTVASVNATTLKAQCGLVPNLTQSYDSSSETATISFQSGVNNASISFDPFEGNDVVYAEPPLDFETCPDCPQTAFYLMTTLINVDESVLDPVVVEINFTFTEGNEGNYRNYTAFIYVAACSLSTETALVPLDIQQSQLAVTPDQNTSSLTSWSLWVPGNTTNFSVGIAVPLSMNAVDPYFASLLGLMLSNMSSASPSVTVDPSQLENAIEISAARYLWLAGQLGEAVGGYDRSVGESPATSEILQYRLHLNTVPVILASVASFLALVLATMIIGEGPSKENTTWVRGTSVLECLWLEAHSDTLHSHLQTVKEPSLDRLRAAGMFDIRLGDVGRPNYPEVERPMLDLTLDG